jgi:hypothetical protein
VKPQPKQPPCPQPNPAFARAFGRLDAAVAKATTPYDLSDSDKIDLIRLKLFGPCVRRLIAEERRRRANETNDAINANHAGQ